MRLWSIHPSYLDTKGLLALWRESLLARKVLEGKTKGYKFHPQLLRFKNSSDPLMSINLYLKYIFYEAIKRGYNFNKNKIKLYNNIEITIFVTKGQIQYEWTHLLNKLKNRDFERYKILLSENYIKPHPIFKVIDGNIEEWEKILK